MTKHVVYTGSKEVWTITSRTRLRSLSEDEISYWLSECDLEDCANRYEFATAEEAMNFVNNYRTYTEIEQAWACKVMVADYAVYEIETYDDDGEFDFGFIQFLKCSAFDYE